MYTLLLLTCGQVGCSGGGYYQQVPQFYPPPLVFEQRQFYSQQFQSPYDYGRYSSPAWSPGWSPSPAWSPGWSPYSNGYQRGVNVQLFGRPLIGIQGYRSGFLRGGYCPTCP